MVKRFWGCLCGLFAVFTIFFLSASPIKASADTGPKPSVNIAFKNMGVENCYGTLLSKYASTGPASVWDGNEESVYLNGLDKEIWEAFVNYKDSDGYYFLQTAVWHCSETKRLNWTYYPPTPFKILLYYPDSGTFVSSGIYERYAFDSYFTVDMKEVEIGAEEGTHILLTADKSYDYTRELISLICRIVITIALEIGIAFLFGFRERKLFLTILSVNVVTQVILNVLLNIINYNQGALAFLLFYFLFEFVVLVIETIAYGILFKRFAVQRIHPGKILLYTVIANVVSFAGGFVIIKFVPGIF